MKPHEQKVYEQLPALTSGLFDLHKILRGMPLDTMLSMANRVLLTGVHTVDGQPHALSPDDVQPAIDLIQAAIAMRDAVGDLGEQAPALTV